jgi:hypothetical protein
MADTGTGIQELMAAETRASQIVAEARIGTFEMRQILFRSYTICVFILRRRAGTKFISLPCCAGGIY